CSRRPIPYRPIPGTPMPGFRRRRREGGPRRGPPRLRSAFVVAPARRGQLTQTPGYGKQTSPGDSDPGLAHRVLERDSEIAPHTNPARVLGPHAELELEGAVAESDEKGLRLRFLHGARISPCDLEEQREHALGVAPEGHAQVHVDPPAAVRQRPVG